MTLDAPPLPHGRRVPASGCSAPPAPTHVVSSRAAATSLAGELRRAAAGPDPLRPYQIACPNFGGGRFAEATSIRRHVADLPAPATMYRAVRAPRPHYEGVFWLGVRTTGIFRQATVVRGRRSARTSSSSAPRQSAARGVSAVHEVPSARPRPQAAANWWRSCWSPWNVRPLRRYSGCRAGANSASTVDAARAPVQALLRHDIPGATTGRGAWVSRSLDIRKGKTVIDSQLDQGFESGSGFRDAFTRIVGTAPSRAHGRRRIARQVARNAARRSMLALGGRPRPASSRFRRPARPRTRARDAAARLNAKVLPGEHRYLTQIERELRGIFRRHADSASTRRLY